MVATNINETYLVIVESDHSHSRRTRSNSRVVVRSSLQGFKPETITILKDTYESWGKEDGGNFNSILNDKRENHASVTLQRVARGWLARMNTRVLVLEQKLAAIGSDKEYQLAQIQKQKLAKMQEIKRQVEQELDMNFESGNDTLNTARKIIDELRSENQMIRKHNATMKGKILELKQENERLQKAHAKFESNLLQLSTHVEQATENMSRYEATETLFRMELNNAIQRQKTVNQSIDWEQSTANLYKTTMKKVLDSLRETLGTCSTSLRDDLIDILENHKKVATN